MPHTIKSPSLPQPQICPHATQNCGGCAWQGLSDTQQATQHMAKLAQLGLLTAAPIITLPPANRWRFMWQAHHVAKGDVQLGLFARGTHSIVPMQQCGVMHPVLETMLPVWRNLMATALNVGQAGQLQVSYLNLENFDVVLRTPKMFNVKTQQALIALAQQHGVNRLAWQKDELSEPEVFYSTHTLVKKFGDFEIDFPSAAFLQASAQSEQTLQQLVVQAVAQTKAKYVADLFAGLGTLSWGLLALPHIKKISTFELAGSSTDALIKAAKNPAVKSRLQVHARNLKQMPLLPTELNMFDCIVLDPPRRGAPEQMLHLAKSTVPHVVYVSCNPKSFAADAAVLQQAGYILTQLTPVDQFAFSGHLEVVGVFRRG